ncbi:G patch domain-containing protein 4 [Physocladia obscura]|uniref:G patch domain-containing protein 4 n=1 Tax=Physocladia obscura TaxID=109957 RepID=A0AAD5T0Y5_9FUNG|nr:G patch domain-containing protein 4 [Physocladia obscura]
MSFGGIGSGNSVGNILASSWAEGNFGASDDHDVSLASSHLKKLGWKHGEGLGKKRDGINRAISVSFKKDTKGIGESSKDEFAFTWWDHVFNKAATQIKIHKDDDGEVKVKLEKNSKKEKKLLYGSFVKTSSGNESDDDDKDYSVKVTDEELFKACEGRTARKGARAEQPGKLKRAIVESKSDDEKNVSTDLKAPVALAENAKSKKRKDRSSKKRKLSDSGVAETFSEMNEAVVTKKKRKDASGKKQKHSAFDKSLPDSTAIVPAEESKKKKKRNNREIEEQDIKSEAQSDSFTIAKHKKIKKSKNVAVVDEVPRKSGQEKVDTEEEKYNDSDLKERKGKKSKKTQLENNDGLVEQEKSKKRE